MLIIWPVLLPINAVNQRGSAENISGLNLLSISNVSSPKRYWAHVAMAIAFVGIKTPFVGANGSGDLLLIVP